MSKRTHRDFDLVVFGATSFVGQILCQYLVDRHGVDGELRWAIAGRSAAKLDAVATDTGAKVPQIVADAADPTALAALAGSTDVVISTVGPYALYGSPLVAAVAAAGTDYCDLTGEPQWMQRMIDAHGAEAEASGARIIHSCGFDSIPSDLGVWFTQREAKKLFGSPCRNIAMRVKALKGGASGGTIASLMNMMDEVSHDKALRKVLGNSYALAPEGMRSGVKQPNVIIPQRDEASGEWVAPFVMSTVNSQIVHRSHALLGRPWGEDFTYGEAMTLGRGPVGIAKASAVSAGVAGFMGVAAIGPVRSVLKRVLPEPGEGPSPEAQEKGHFDIRFFGTTAAAEPIRTQVTGDRDPGYGSTAKMLGEAAMALLELNRSAVGGGFWTPATALGDALIDRLEAHAGLTFTVLDD